MEICLRIEGPAGEKLVGILENRIRQEFSVETASRQEALTEGGDNSRDTNTKLAMAAIVLALPGFLNDTADLAERFQLKQRIEKLMDAIEEENPGNNKVWIEIDGKPFLPRRNNLEKILDSVDAAQ